MAITLMRIREKNAKLTRNLEDRASGTEKRKTPAGRRAANDRDSEQVSAVALLRKRGEGRETMKTTS